MKRPVEPAPHEGFEAALREMSRTAGRTLTAVDLRAMSDEEVKELIAKTWPKESDR